MGVSERIILNLVLKIELAQDRDKKVIICENYKDKLFSFIKQSIYLPAE